MNLLAGYIIFIGLTVNSAKLLRRSASPPGRVSIKQKDEQ